MTTTGTGIVQVDAQHADAADAWALVRALIAKDQDAVRVILRTVDLHELIAHLAGLVVDVAVPHLGSVEALDELLSSLQERGRERPA
jgi:hypothetical protein